MANSIPASELTNHPIFESNRQLHKQHSYTSNLCDLLPNSRWRRALKSAIRVRVKVLEVAHAISPFQPFLSHSEHVTSNRRCNYVFTSDHAQCPKPIIRSIVLKILKNHWDSSRAHPNNLLICGMYCTLCNVREKTGLGLPFGFQLVKLVLIAFRRNT